MRSRSAPVLHGEPRSRLGFGGGKSITYGRLSPPLSAFNHTLCEQNIKTCPFVCRRRIVAGRAPRGLAASGAGSGAVAGRLSTRPASLLRTKFSEVFLQRSTVLYCNVRKIGGGAPPANSLTLLHCYR